MNNLRDLLVEMLLDEGLIYSADQDTVIRVISRIDKDLQVRKRDDTLILEYVIPGPPAKEFKPDVKKTMKNIDKAIQYMNNLG